MGFPEIMNIVAGVLQFIVAGYALRLNRLFGSARVGWSLFWAFLLLALLHLIESITPLHNASATPLDSEITITYALASLLLLTGLIHLENLLKERIRLEQKEQQMRAELEREVQKKTARLTKANDDLLAEIDERKRTEQKNREQAMLLDEASDAIWGLDLNEHINFWNKGAERIYGWSAAEALGKNPMELLHKGIRTPQFEECINAMKTEGAWTGELEEFTKDGKSIVVHSRCNAVQDDQVRLKSLLVINRDITEKKHLETQFLRSQRMESLGTLAGGMAHDLNNILSPLLFSVYLLRDKVADNEGQQLLNTMETSVQRGAKIIKQVLAFGRGVRGDRVPVQLPQLVREVEQIVSETFPKSVEFEARSAANLWDVKGDVTQLHQVLLNLCVNARDAMPDGGKLSIQIENVELDEIFARQNFEASPGPHVVVTVADTGIGMPRKIQDRIFEPFFTTKEVNKGTGLGLSTCLGIVKSHGGFITCQSEPSRGSIFKVYLPATVTPETANNHTSKKSNPSSGRNELVLVVDDEKPIREVAKRTLERSGYRVVTAANGAEAISIYQRQKKEIAAVVIDMSMPVMDGYTAIAALKVINPEIKIIGASGLDIPEKMNGDANLGCRQFMPKPYTAETLLHTLNGLLTATGAA